MISALISGITGVFLGYLFNAFFQGMLFFFLFSIYPYSYYAFLSILFGGIGGLLGNQIKIKKKY